MKLNMHAAGAAILAASLIVPSAFAASNAAKKPVKKTAKTTKTVKEPSTSEQIQALRNSLEQRINKLEGNLAAKDAELTQAKQDAAAAKAQAAQAQAAVAASNQAASENAAAVSKLQGSVSDLKSSSSSLTTQVSEINTKSAKKSELSDLAFGKVKIGGTFFGDYSYWSDAGYAPTFIDTANSNQPTGPGKSGFSSFNITRAYLNFTYTPNDAVSLRITPDVYRTTADGSLAYRLKFAYVDFNTLFKGFKYIDKTKVTFGQTNNPLVGWEDNILGNRFAYTAPWNYVGLSSTYVGAKIGGPIQINGLTYIDYDLAVFANGAYSSIDSNDKKQFMGRVTAYPFGTKRDQTGLGVTVFGNFGYSSSATIASAPAANFPVDRLAVIVSYQTTDKAYGIVGEYDLGHNAFSKSTLFPTSPNTNWTAPSNAFSAIATAALPTSAPATRQQGFAVQGQARLGQKKSPFSIFGVYQYFQPNTQFNIGDNGDALDFSRTVGGLKYKFTKNFDLAVGDQNFHWLDSRGAANGGDTNAITLWSQYNF